MFGSKQSLAGLAVALVVVAAGCVGGLATTTPGPTDGASTDDAGPTAATASSHGDDRSVTVATSGEATAAPDRAVLHVAVQTTADSAEAARQRLAGNVSTFRSALTDAGIDDDNVTTRYYDIRQTRESRDRQGVTEYRAIHAFSIDLGDVDRVGELIELSVENGATDIQNVEFTLSEAKESQLREEALSAAMANADADATVLAENTNLSLVGVQSVSTGHVNVRPYRAELTAAAAGDSGTSIDSGPVTVTAQVEVTYNATG
ncbi:MAG: SIMPL domain-containing protein [Halobacteriota archaeon]